MAVVKHQFLVTITGDWSHNGTPVNKRHVQKMLREGVAELFDFVAITKVEPIKKDQPQLPNPT